MRTRRSRKDNEGARYLWIAVVELALKDLRHPDPKLRRDSQRFFRSAWGVEVMRFAGFSASAVQRKLRERGVLR